MTAGCTGTWIRSVKPPFSCWLTIPSGVPSAIAVTGMPAPCANCVAWSGVTRPAVWPPSERMTITAGGRLAPGFLGTVFATLTARATASASAVPCGPVCARASAARASALLWVGGVTSVVWSENVITATRYPFGSLSR